MERGCTLTKGGFLCEGHYPLEFFFFTSLKCHLKLSNFYIVFCILGAVDVNGELGHVLWGRRGSLVFTHSFIHSSIKNTLSTYCTPDTLHGVHSYREGTLPLSSV